MSLFFRGLLILFAIFFAGSLSVQPGRNTLLFTIHQERDVYDLSDYGEPPQFAIWIEDPAAGTVKTVFVTHRSGSGDFEGKAECPVSLPVWFGIFKKETGSKDIPTIFKPAADAITGATPKVPDFIIQTIVPEDSRWNYYIEVNVSGDYTPAFPSLQSDGEVDSQGNGQPSIIYRGEIVATPGNNSIPELIGRTEQLYMSTKINPDIKDIQNAKDVFSKIEITCIKGIRK